MYLASSGRFRMLNLKMPFSTTFSKSRKVFWLSIFAKNLIFLFKAGLPSKALMKTCEIKMEQISDYDCGMVARKMIALAFLAEKKKSSTFGHISSLNLGQKSRGGT